MPSSPPLALPSAIVKAVKKVFAEKGFDGTTTRELAVSAGVSEALLFKHFPSKESLYAAMQSSCCPGKNSEEARKRADALQGRLQKRLDEIAKERQLSPLPPVVLGGLLVVPGGLISAMQDKPVLNSAKPVDTQVAGARARAIIMEVERSLGFVPTDRELEKLGYDIESAIPGTGRLRFLEVKGRVSGAETITVTKNEILYSLNKPEDFILAVVEFLDETRHKVHYVRQPFQREPDFAAASVNYRFAELLALAAAPS